MQVGALLEAMAKPLHDQFLRNARHLQDQADDKKDNIADAADTA